MKITREYFQGVTIGAVAASALWAFGWGLEKKRLNDLQEKVDSVDFASPWRDATLRLAAFAPPNVLQEVADQVDFELIMMRNGIKGDKR